MSGNPDFKGRVAVVTGGARGIGLAITRALAERGASVHVFDVAKGEGSDPPPYRFHKVDIADSAAVAAAVSLLPDGATLLVNNAGITRDRTLVNMTDDEWRSVLSVNLTGAFHMARALAPGMRKAGYGRIVNITSINGMRGKFGQANYSASKAGLIGLTKALARELGPKGVTVNAVAPGMVMTEMAAAVPPEVLAKAKAESVLPALATPEDVAAVVLFLLSDAARMVTGEVIRVDAGQYI
ncbi:MAG: SDR family oxidoreductase [Deltaproteobacteria bacterium]|nr:MAG: SDR family oxidoreductase [Deltaproteobacteria bacterium]